MPSGIFGASIVTLTNGTTASASDVMSSLNSLKSNGLNNDSTLIQTDGSGNIISPAGQLRNVTLITPNNILAGVTINAGVTNTYTAWGATGIPSSGVIAVIAGVTITSASVGYYVQFGSHGGTMGQYFTCGNVQVANQGANCCGVIPLDGSGKFDVKANAVNGTVTVWIYGYIY